MSEDETKGAPRGFEAATAGPQRPEYEPKTPDQALGYLVEEFGEVLAAIGKTQRWGPFSINPELKRGDPLYGETNRDWVLRELNDAEAAIERIRRFYGVEVPRDSDEERNSNEAATVPAEFLVVDGARVSSRDVWDLRRNFRALRDWAVNTLGFSEAEVDALQVSHRDGSSTPAGDESPSPQGDSKLKPYDAEQTALVEELVSVTLQHIRTHDVAHTKGSEGAIYYANKAAGILERMGLEVPRSKGDLR